MEKVIIIGSGPAGYTAAIYAARAELAPVMFSGEAIGGQLMTTTEVENFPGFPDGILGPDLMAAMRRQAEKFGAKIIEKSVTAVDLRSDPKKITVGGEVFEAKAVIIATGASARRLNLPGENKFYGKGLSACATCDGFFYKGKKAIVVGGGDAAMEEANFLTKFAAEVTILVRTEKIRASRIMQERAEANPKIKFVFNASIVSYLGEGKITGARVKDSITGKETDMPIDGIFTAIGHDPNTKIFEGQLPMEKGYIVPEGSVRTPIPGVFAAGDVADWRYRQAVSAAGTGCMAALEAEKYLAGRE
jgi:thioredoxin reductase (NADPH)